MQISSRNSSCRDSNLVLPCGEGSHSRTLNSMLLFSAVVTTCDRSLWQVELNCLKYQFSLIGINLHSQFSVGLHCIFLESHLFLSMTSINLRCFVQKQLFITNWGYSADPSGLRLHTTTAKLVHGIDTQLSRGQSHEIVVQV